MRIAFNRPRLSGRELDYVQRAIDRGRLSSGGTFTNACEGWLEERTGSEAVVLTHTCTAALEMAALLTGIGPGDEVILPAWTFVSTANAFALRSATPVFVDIRPDTMNIDETKIEAAITDRTKAIIPVHYGGVGAEMDTIMAIADRHGLWVIEDAAQGFGAKYRGKSLGTIGHLGTLSFHETKNVISGEGGALLVNDPNFVERARIVSEKGTNRNQFTRGEVDKYTWVDLGSSCQPSELTAAFLLAQLENSHDVVARRHSIWRRYDNALSDLFASGRISRPSVPHHCISAAHLFVVLASSNDEQHRVLAHLRKEGIHAVFHYVPLHSAPAGERFGRVHGSMKVTEDLAGRVVRLPLWPDMTDENVEEVAAQVRAALD